MPVSHSRRCIFVHIPKTGGSSIEQALGMFGDWRLEDRDCLFGRIQSPDLELAGFLSRYLQHLTISQIRSIVPADVGSRYFSFSFVRNPWDRLVSVYSRPDPDMVEQAQAAGIDLLGLPFDQFLDRVGKTSHIHVLPQHEFITDSSGRPLVDLVGRFESLQGDFKGLCRTLGAACELPHANASAARRAADYRSYYTSETKAIVAQRYATDVRLFGYEF
jgi:hypothetical protein